MHTTSFCNNHHQVHAQNRNIGKQIIKVLVAGVTKAKYHHVLLYLETQFQQIVNFTKLCTVLSGLFQKDVVYTKLDIYVFIYMISNCKLHDYFCFTERKLV
jgi:hypothetical protein